MKFLATSLLALAGSVAAIGSQNDTLDVAALQAMEFKNISPPVSHIYNGDAVAAPTTDVADSPNSVNFKRGLPYWGSNIYDNYGLSGRPLYGGWSIRVRNTYQFRFQGTSWQIPSDVNGAAYLANNFASAVNSINDDAAIYNFPLPGGWSFDASAAPGWTYSSIPRQMLIDWVTDHCANYAAWTLPQENTFQNSWYSPDGQFLFYFRVYPTTNNGVTDHGETYENPGQAPAPW